MRIKFNKFERVAGVFVLTAVVGSAVATVGIAVKKGWFSSKIRFETRIESADGLHSGTVVNVAGLRAGSVSEVELLSADEVLVKFDVFEKFHGRIREDSRVRVLRPFIIGEKVLDITVGNESHPMAKPGAVLASENTVDMMDLMSGKKLGPLLGTLEGLMENMKILAEAFADTRRTQAFVDMFDALTPLINNMNQTFEKTPRLLGNFNDMAIEVARMVNQLNKVMPQILEEAPEMAHQVQAVMLHLNTLLSTLEPAIKEVGPELPQASLRALEALNEAVIVLKAMQKTFMLRGSVEDVKEEENKRKPAEE
ncbi:MAG: MCE family protein [Pseudobdellovibrionaceae bacterium]|nr:MCE family protein [Bdellovibrionales bacterium]USN48071.1 MAG: MCE family protein [Pseudobdellovibrionaceae bacterium]